VKRGRRGDQPPKRASTVATTDDDARRRRFGTVRMLIDAYVRSSGEWARLAADCEKHSRDELARIAAGIETGQPSDDGRALLQEPRAVEIRRLLDADPSEEAA
jgi:hypothetical protein